MRLEGVNGLTTTACIRDTSLDDLGRANIVLVGISRTSKTPLSIYLAVRGYFVANVPIVPGVDPPEELKVIVFELVRTLCP